MIKVEIVEIEHRKKTIDKINEKENRATWKSKQKKNK